MRLQLSSHALFRMGRRGIRKRDLLAVLEGPTMSWASKNEPGRTVFTGEAEGRTLRVVTVDGTDPVIVVTAFWPEEE